MSADPIDLAALREWAEETIAPGPRPATLETGGNWRRAREHDRAVAVLALIDVVEAARGIADLDNIVFDIQDEHIERLKKALERFSP